MLAATRERYDLMVILEMYINFFKVFLLTWSNLLEIAITNYTRFSSIFFLRLVGQSTICLSSLS